MTSRRRLRVPLPWAIAVITLASVCVMALQVPLDTDTYWHLAAGEWQVQNGSILREDVFSSTRIGEPWINHSWLSQFVIFGVYSLAGDLGLALLTSLLAAAGMAFVYLQCDADPLITALTIILASASAAIFWSARPQMISFFLSTIVLYLIWLYDVKTVNRLWIIPILMVLWVNLHAGFAIGFVLLVLYSMGLGLRWLLNDRTEGQDVTFKQMVQPVLVGLVAAAAVSLNPYGPRMLFYPFQTVGIDALRDFIQEWAIPNFRSPQVWPFLWLLLLTFISAGLSSKPVRITQAVMLVGTAYLALLAARNISTFSIVAAPVLATHLQTLLRDYRLRLNSSRLPATGSFAIINMILIGLALGGIGAKAAYEFQPGRVDELRSAFLPLEANQYLLDEQPPQPLFNSYNWGGYLIWENSVYPVFVDGRTDLYGDDILLPHLTMYLTGSDWQTALDEYDINTVLVEPNSPLGLALPSEEGWQTLYEDEVAIVISREDSN